jgi:hypothetical protein
MSGHPSLARRIIRTLRAGGVNSESASRIKTATAHIEAEFERVLDAFVGGANVPEPLLIEGDWGSGKSHLRMLLRHELRRRRIPYVSSAVGRFQGSLAHFHLTAPRWLDTIDFGDAHGVRAGLDCGLLSRDGARKWSDSNQSQFARGLRWALRGWHEGWLLALGHCYSMPNYSYQHEKAVELFLSVGDYLRSAGPGRIVLLLDEVENICLQHDIRGRRRSYETLHRLWRSGDFFPVLFVTNKFLSQVQQDWDRGAVDSWDGWSDAAREFLAKTRHGTPLQPPNIGVAAARDLVGRIHAVYAEAYGPTAFASSEKDIIETWLRTSTRSVRLLVRLAVNDLDTAAGQRRQPEGMPATLGTDPIAIGGNR